MVKRILGFLMAMVITMNMAISFAGIVEDYGFDKLTDAELEEVIKAAEDLIAARKTANERILTFGEYKCIVHDDETATIIGYTGSDVDLVIPNEIEGHTVTSIGDYAFSSCMLLNSVEIPDSVTSLGECAFGSCIKMKSINLPNSLIYMGNNPFADCYELSANNLHISSSHPCFTIVNDLLFEKNEKRIIANLNVDRTWHNPDVHIIPDDTRIIGSRAFMHCNNMGLVVIPDSVITIEGMAFFNCVNLTSITIPQSVTTIGNSAFMACNQMSSATLSNGVKAIGAGAFQACENLTSVTIPSSVTSIGENAFYACLNLNISVSPDSYALQYCKDNNLPYTETDFSANQTTAPTASSTPIAAATAAPTQVPAAVPTTMPTNANRTVKFATGKQTEVFNEQGVRMYLTGEVNDTGNLWMGMNAIVENHTDRNIRVSFRGICNGWSVNYGIMGGLTSSVQKGAKGKSYIWLTYDDLEIKRFSDIHDLTLTFTVEDITTGEALFTIDDVTFQMTGKADTGSTSVVAEADLEYYDECPILPKVDSYRSVYQSGSSRSSLNGKVNKIMYTYQTKSNNASLKDAFNEYVEELKKLNFTVKVSGSTATINSGSKKLATLSNTGSKLEMSLIPGNEKLKTKPTAPSSQNSGTGSSSIVAVENLSYYNECPILPQVDAYYSVYQSGRSSSSSNGKVTKVVYTYKTNNDNISLRDAFNEYVEELKKLNFTVKVSGSTATINSGSKKLATLTISSNKLEMNLVPGNEKLKAKPTASSSQKSGTNSSSTSFSNNGDLRVKLGQTFSQKNNFSMKLTKASTANKIYSYANKKINGVHQYMDAENSSNTLLYAYGTFTNNGSRPVDIRNMYATITMNGKDTYKASVVGVLDGKSKFINDVSPKETVGVYVYAEMPRSVAKVANAVIRLGFTENFDFRVVKNNLPDFTYCYATYEIPLKK